MICNLKQQTHSKYYHYLFEINYLCFFIMQINILNITCLEDKFNILLKVTKYGKV